LAETSGGTPPYQVNWSPGGILGDTLTMVAPGSYSVEVSDANGCEVSGSLELVEWPDFNILLSAVPPSCHDKPDGEIAVVVLTGGNGIYTYAWNTGQTQDFLDGLSGGQVYSVTVTDSQGCTGSKSRPLENPEPLQFSLLPTFVACHGDSSGSVTVSDVQHANGQLQYVWTPNAGGQTTATATQLPAGSYGVTITDDNGCTSASFANIQEADPLVPVFQVVDNPCFGYEDGQVSVTVSGGQGPYDLLWASGAQTDTLSRLPAGDYPLTITDATGCVVTTSVTVGAPATVDPGTLVDPVSCFGGRDGRVTIQTNGGTPPYQYSLDDGDAFQYSNVLIALEAGSYDITILDAQGCRYKTSATVEEPPAMEVDILVWNQSVDEYVTSFGDSVPLYAAVLHGIGELTYFWDASYCGTLFQEGLSDCDQTPFSNAIWSKPSYSVDYFLTVTDENGCEASDMVQLHVKKERVVEVPTGFSPNDDGLHERLLVHGKRGTRVMSFQVFDRWGERLYEEADFEVNSPDHGWDGTYRSNPMPPGVYAWYLEVLFPDGSAAAYRGESTLLR
jgi:gliding motility-associated-like protein